ncbi:MAG: outer membrane protein assembly factor BamD [Arcobacteraceae bacterium]|nr:outer membrane protein assembly factor BamD [Arcobacteraceae bacterium]
MRQIITLVLAIFIFTACSSKQKDLEYNKPAVYWYNKMLKQVASYNIDEADDTYTSLESEHKNSPLLPSALMIIATAHMEQEEYAMANYYFDEYLKKFGMANNVDYVRYLKVKAKFMGFKNQFREQELVSESIEDAKMFIEAYPDSKYIHMVKTIKSRLDMAKAVFDQEISELYTRMDKPKASEVYSSRAKESWDDMKSVDKVDVPWYRAIFE